MKFVTFNIRCDFNQDGNNSFCYRKPLVLKKIEAEKPDVICFQEVLPHVADWLSENLKEYYVVGCGRDPHLADEQVSVAFLREKYNLIHMDTFWLSETPMVPASRYEEQSDCPRVTTEVLLQERGTDKVFRVVNTHLDHMGVGARKLGLRQILKYLDEVTLMPDAPVILAGDFNAEPDGDEMSVFDEYKGYTNATEGIGITYHGYHEPDAEPERIDYIYLRGPWTCGGVEKWEDCENGVYISDHYPICAQICRTEA